MSRKRDESSRSGQKKSSPERKAGPGMNKGSKNTRPKSSESPAGKANRQALALKVTQERYRTLVELSPVAIWTHRGGPIEFANPAACSLFGVSAPEQLYSKTAFELFHPDYHEEIKERIRLVKEGNRAPRVEAKIVRLDGSVRDVEIAAAPFMDEKGPAIQAILRDITESKQKERQLQRLNRTLKALNNSNQAMMRATTEAALLQQVCRIVTDDCGYAMVWIGFAEDDEQKSVRPVAYAGFEEGYLETLGITWADTERGRGPTGTAIRTGQPCSCHNMLTDPQFAPWRQQALKRGYSASLVVPLLAEGKAFGAITIYSKEPDPFSADEVKLLMELAGDLSHGLGALRLHEAKAKAEEALRQSEQRVRLKLESILSPEGDVGKLEMADIIDAAGLQVLMEQFYELAPIPMAILDMKGRMLVGVGWQDICTKFHRANPETCKHCTESDLELSAGVPPGEFKLYKCKNNMWDVATPIMVGGKHVGNLFAGQFFFEDESPDRESFRLQAKQYGFNEKEYMAALDRAPRLSREKMATGMSYLVKLADMISKLSYSNIKLARAIGERDILAESLRTSEARLRVTLTSIGDAVMTCDAAGNIMFLNPTAEELAGWKTEEVLGRPIQSIFRIIKEDTGKPAEDIAGEVLRERRKKELANHTSLVARDGRVVPIEDSAAPIINDAGELAGVVIVFHDVTERRRAQEALRRSQERLKFHFENTPLAVIEWGPDFRLARWSQGAERIFGWRAEEVLGKRLDEFRWVHEEDVEKVAEISTGLLDGSRPRSVSPNRNYRKDGSVAWCEWYNSSLLDESGKMASILSLVLDVTDRKHAEEALIRSEKLSSVGRMAAAFAHEINNPLEAVTNALYIARMNSSTPKSVKQYLDIADEELMRVAHITRQVLGFYRESAMATEVSVSAILDSIVELLQARIKAKRAIIEKEYSGDIKITAFGGELRQVFSNLLANALDASDEGGVIRIRASRQNASTGKAGVRVMIADRGKGIDPAAREHIFEALFTTKGLTGTGLGLWVARQIVEKHGGTIRFRSRVGGEKTGTVFSVVLPEEIERAKAQRASAGAD